MSSLAEMSDALLIPTLETFITDVGKLVQREKTANRNF